MSELQAQVNELARNHGDWFYDMPLPDGVWTRGNEGLPHTRLKRIVQVVADTVGKPLSQCRVLDLGCLEGQFAIEFAQQGALAVGIEIREANVAKARFVKDALKLQNVEFFKSDVRDIGHLGSFDAIICSGILYHLTAEDALQLIQQMAAMSPVVVIDTHVSLRQEQRFGDYWGRSFQEHGAADSAAKKEARRWASADNETSFWFTRPSLVNALSSAGFTSVYECFSPAHMNFGKPGMECPDRCTFVAIKGTPVKLITSPAANDLAEKWPEGTLAYSPQSKMRRFLKAVTKRLSAER